MLQRFYHEGLAQAGYLLGCQATGEALVGDSNRQLDHYRDAAARSGLPITGVTETQIHVDFVSGARTGPPDGGAALLIGGRR